MKHLSCCFRPLFSYVLSVFFLTGYRPPQAWAVEPAAKGGGLYLSSPVMVGILIGSTVFLLAAVRICQILVRRYRTRADETQKHAPLMRKPYRLMVENTDEGIFVLQKLEFKYANQKAFNLVGIPVGDQESTQLSDYLDPRDMDIVLEQYEKVILRNEISGSFSARAVKNDGSVLWTKMRFIPIIWEEAPAVLGYFRDITIQKIMEQDLQQAQRMEAIAALSGGIAHDFNNILTTIIGTAEIALMDLEEEDPQKGEFDRIRESGYRARDLVRQILTISRESAQADQALYLTPMIKEALKLLKSTLPKEITINSHIDSNLNLVKVDAIQVYQVLMNLCTNARDALKNVDAPSLEILAKNVVIEQTQSEAVGGLFPGQYVLISVRDNGTGIDTKIADHIFEPYFTTKDDTSNSGLGLATAMGIVKDHGGTIDFESMQGQGSCFNVHLPVYEPEQAGAGQEVEPVNQTPGRVLFVDDEEEITIVAERMLKKLGFSVMVTNSGRNALEAFSRAPEFFDVMITDLSMPGMSGRDLAMAVLRIRPDLPVIICTGHSDTFDQNAAKKIGISAYVKKPYDLKGLSSMAASFIKKSKAA